MRDIVCVCVGVAVALKLGVPVVEGVAVDDCDAVSVGVSDWERDCDSEGVKVEDWDALKETLGI